MKDIFIILGLVLLNGLFSLSETALISARKTRLKQQRDKGSNSARIALEIANNPDRFLSTVQIGITLIGILTGLYSGAALADSFSEVLEKIGLSTKYTHDVAQISIIVVVTYLSIVLGELVPKCIAINSADSVAKLVAKPMKILSVLSHPAVWLLSVSTKMIMKLLNIRSDENMTTEGDVKQVIESGAESGEVQAVERDIMNRTLIMGDLRVGNIMTPRIDVLTLSAEDTASDVKETIRKEIHNTYPVIDRKNGNKIKIAKLKDLIFRIDEPDFSLRSILREAVLVPESMSVYSALEKLKTEEVHSLVVCDEFGQMQGLISLNDILEGLVGSNGDSLTEPFIIKRADGSYLVDGQCPLYDFFNYFDAADLYEPANFSTVAGLILENLRNIPKEGDSFKWKRFQFEIVDMDGVRIDKLLVNKEINPDARLKLESQT